MINLLTLCDNGYYEKGRALHYSLIQHCGDFILHWLCLDEAIYDRLTADGLDNVVLYRLSDMEREHPELIEAKQNPATTWGTQWSQYCWTLNPWFTNWILKNKIEDGEKLISVDSDIFFYRSPQEILDAVGNKSVGIHTHRFSGPYDSHSITGYFNVGVVVFTKDHSGIEMSDFWEYCMLNPDNKFAAQYGKCGDQAYVSLFYENWRNDVCVFDREGIRHFAPWATEKYLNNNPHFLHFSHFTMTNDGWRDNTHGEWNPSKEPHIKPYYEEYYKIIKEIC